MVRLYVISTVSPATSKALSPEEGVYLGNVDADCSVYLFAFTGMSQLNPKLREELVKWGKGAGKNLFVGFWANDDKDFKKVRGSFGLKKFPAIVMTAEPKLAEMHNTSRTVYARIDDEKTLEGDSFVPLAKKTFERLYLLFLDGNVQKAIKEAEKVHNDRRITEFLSKLPGIKKFFDEHKTSIEIGPFKFSTEPSKTG